MNAIEKLIARRVAADLIAAGYFVTVDFDRGYEPSINAVNSQDVDAIVTAADEGDECHFMVDRNKDRPEEEPFDAFVFLIWGNGDEGRTCVSNYSTSLSSIIEPIYDWAEKFDPAEIAVQAVDALIAIRKARGNCGGSPFEQAAIDKADAAIAALYGSAPAAAAPLAPADTSLALYEFKSYPEGAPEVVVTRSFNDRGSAKGFGGRMAKKSGWPVDIAIAGSGEWSDRYLTTAEPNVFTANGYSFGRIDG